MKKSIILLGSLFILGLLVWAISPGLFVGTPQLNTQSIDNNLLTKVDEKKDILNKTGGSPVSFTITEKDIRQNDTDNKEGKQKEEVVSEPKPTSEPVSTSQNLGSFSSPDSSYSSRGQLSLRTEGNRQFLDFKNFSVSNGPDLFVTLNKRSNPNSGNLGEHKTLQKLKSISGSQSYDVTGIDLSDYESLAVYCDRFSKVFAVAQL